MPIVFESSHIPGFMVRKNPSLMPMERYITLRCCCCCCCCCLGHLRRSVYSFVSCVLCPLSSCQIIISIAASHTLLTQHLLPLTFYFSSFSYSFPISPFVCLSDDRGHSSSLWHPFAYQRRPETSGEEAGSAGAHGIHHYQRANHHHTTLL